MRRKWRNRALERGVLIDKRGYVYVRLKHRSVERKELIGRTTDLDVIDRANFRAQELRYGRWSSPKDLPMKRRRLLMEDAADLFLKLHGEKRSSAKGIKQFGRYVRLIKRAWSGRYVDSLIGDDVRDYRDHRRQEGVSESTINREQTAIITLFNKLVEWRRCGQLPRNVQLPEGNPGNGIKKVNEDRFIRSRLLSDKEYESLLTCADRRVRRIMLAALNLPLRLEDLKRLSKKNINYRTGLLYGIQTKTGQDYALPINKTLWELIQTAAGDQILDFSGFAKRWRRAVKRAGLHPKSQRPIQFRDLRRTAATTLHESGESLRTISAMLGHRSVTTTVRYLGLKQENLKRAGDTLATKYGLAAENVKSQLENVPNSVPNTCENGLEELHDRVDKSTNLAG
jgi:integrase